MGRSQTVFYRKSTISLIITLLWKTRKSWEFHFWFLVNRPDLRIAKMLKLQIHIEVIKRSSSAFPTIESTRAKWTTKRRKLDTGTATLYSIRYSCKLALARCTTNWPTANLTTEGICDHKCSSCISNFKGLVREVDRSSIPNTLLLKRKDFYFNHHVELLIYISGYSKLWRCGDSAYRTCGGKHPLM